MAYWFGAHTPRETSLEINHSSCYGTIFKQALEDKGISFIVLQNHQPSQKSLQLGIQQAIIIAGKGGKHRVTPNEAEQIALQLISNYLDNIDNL